MTPILYLVIALGAALPTLYGFMAVKEKYAVAMAVGIEKSNGIAVCNGRVAEIERVHNAKVAASTKEAARAADLVPDPPASDAELAALCKKSASCRSRGSL